LSTQWGELQDIGTIALWMTAATRSILSPAKNATTPKALSIFSLLFLAALILSGPLSSKAQTGAAVSGQVVTPTGTPAYNAQLYACTYNSSGIPCYPQVPIYNNPALSGSPITQPTATDQNGNYNFWVANGTTVLVQVKINATVTYSYFYTAGGSGSGTGCTTSGTVGTILGVGPSGTCENLDAGFASNTFTFGVSSAHAFTVQGTTVNLNSTSNATLLGNGSPICTAGNGECATAGGTIPVWPNIYYSATAPNNTFTYASVIIGGVGYTVTIPSGCPGTFGNSTTNATSSTALVFTDVTTSTTLCTLTFTSASATPTITGSGGTLSSGDTISLTVATADATLAGVTAELAGTTPGAGGGGSFTPGLDLSGSSTSQEVIGVLGNALPSLTPGFLNWTGSAWAFSAVSSGIPYPTGTGIPCVSTSTSWCTTFNGSNLIPTSYLPLIILTSGVVGVLPVANGGSGTPTPSLVSGAGISVSGTWPNQTITNTGGGGGGMTWPAAAGIPCYTGSSSWCTSYSSSNLIPASYVSILNQNTAGNAATASSLLGTPSQCSTGQSGTGILSNGNATGCAPLGGSPLWSSLLNPVVNLALTMGANSTTFTYGAVTGSSPMMLWQDSTGNTGTAPLGLFSSASGSSAPPWEALANGIGWEVGTNGALQSVGGTTHGITIAAGTAASGVANKVIISSDATNGYLEANENNTGPSRVCTAGNGVCATTGPVNLCGVSGMIGGATLTGATCSGGKIGYSGVASVTIAAIPGTYLNLRLLNKAFVATGDVALILSFNSDTTTAHYTCQLLGAIGTGIASSTNSCAGFSIPGGLAAGAFGTNSSDEGVSDIVIPIYADGNMKVVTGTFFEGNDPQSGTDGGRWNQTSAITSITIAAVGGGNITGSLALYGTN